MLLHSKSAADTWARGPCVGPDPSCWHGACADLLRSMLVLPQQGVSCKLGEG